MLNFISKPFSLIDLPHGEYVITDPCYLFDGDMWQKLCDEVFCNDANDSSTGILEVEGFTIWWGTTAYGDGSYDVIKRGQSIGEFGVDAGLFAIIPADFIKKHCKGKGLFKQKGIAVKAEFGGRVYYVDGNMRCGAIDVQTDGKGDGEEEDDIY